MSEYIIPHKHHINKTDRNKKKKHRSLTIWFTGLSGSGKSTIANLLEQHLFAQGIHTYILDGDTIRTGLNKNLDFSPEGRSENIRRIGEVCKLFADAGIVVLSAFISPLHKDRQRVRELMDEGEFVEVFVSCPLEVCEERDVKGLYAKARQGLIKNFTGIDAPFEEPENPECILHTDRQEPADCVAELARFILPKLKLNH